VTKVLFRIGRVLWFPVAVVVVWELMSAVRPNPFFVRPSVILGTLSSVIAGDWLIQILLPTILLTLGGYGFGVVFGVVFGAIIGCHPFSLQVLGPIAVFIRSTPNAAIIPIILAIFGIGSVSLYVAVAVAVGFQVLLVTMLGIARTDSAALETAQIMKLGPVATLIEVRFPRAMGDVLAALHAGIQTALLVAITVEILAGGAGMGRFVIEALNAFRVAHLWVGVVVVGLLGIVLHEVFLRLEKRIAPWYFQVKG
jgi:ABC-type nitrate/sulfonate/bicarbonate transport system permease component